MKRYERMVEVSKSSVTKKIGGRKVKLDVSSIKQAPSYSSSTHEAVVQIQVGGIKEPFITWEINANMDTDMKEVTDQIFKAIEEYFATEGKTVRTPNGLEIMAKFKKYLPLGEVSF